LARSEPLTFHDCTFHRHRLSDTVLNSLNGRFRYILTMITVASVLDPIAFPIAGTGFFRPQHFSGERMTA